MAQLYPDFKLSKTEFASQLLFEVRRVANGINGLRIKTLWNGRTVPCLGAATCSLKEWSVLAEQKLFGGDLKQKCFAV